ncbi:hypothetical protein [Aeromicrobium sp. Root236]|uniref:hypothetical protein n=1 Tax=Aeromicrobium sp. Root236 TaxID=1736498 RepID=UPI000A7A1F45|nr:hypothetical protein [Aeromicrobium sp. Root236]
MNPSPSTSPFRSPELRSRSLVVIALLAALAAAASLVALRTTSTTTTDALAPAASVTSTSSSGGLLGGLLPTTSLVTTPVVTTAPAAAPVAAAPSGTKASTPATTTPAPAATTDPMAMPATSDVCTGLESSVDVFLQHLYAAHLETSVGQQVTDALNLDQYLKTHLVLVENMLKPLLGGTQQTLDAFLQHVYSAHLETSLGQQVNDALSVDQYVKTHTVWVESLIKPLVGADLSSC